MSQLQHKFELLADWCIGNHVPNKYGINNNQNLVIQIHNNQVYIVGAEYLKNGFIEQRQYSILKMLENVCKRHTVSNVIFSYCTKDRCNSPNESTFTHARLKDSYSKNILAPCFTFYGYPEKNPDVITTYENSWNNLVNRANQTNYKNKQDALIFVGSLTNENHRITNCKITSDKVDVVIKNQAADSKNFINREDLVDYKYLLHLNGHAGAYASRLKYLLGANSLVFYNSDSGGHTNLWQEWWMKDDFFESGKHFILSNNVTEMQNSLNYYSTHQNEAEKISNDGFEFFKTYLNPTNVYLFWSILLNKYALVSEYHENMVIGKHFNYNLYGS